MLAGAATAPAPLKYVAVVLLTQETIALQVEAKAVVYNVYEQVCQYLQNVGMQEDVELFGLGLELDGEIVLADGDRKISKYASRAWKVSATGTDNSGSPLLVFQLCVRYYLQTPLLLRDQVSRHHYYLQLRKNLLRYGQVNDENTAFHLAALALQADLGDSCDNSCRGPYFDPVQYCPPAIISKAGRSEIIAKVSLLHQQHRGVPSDQAKDAFIEAASTDAAPHNVHLYTLRRKKGDPTSQVTLTVGDKGLNIYEEEPNTSVRVRKLESTFPWLTTDLVNFDKKKFTICSSNSNTKHVFYASSDEKSRHLWLLCRLHHQHSYSVRNRVSELLLTRHRLDRKFQRDSLQHRLRTMGSNSEANKSLDSINLHVDDRLIPRQSTQAKVNSGSLDSLQNYLSGSASSGSSDNALSHDHPTNIESNEDQENERRLSITSSNSPSCSRGTLGRASSVHSSSSQQSASTVRSKYSRMIPELTLGAQLADLALTPELPDLADISAMSAGNINDCDAVDGHDDGNQINRNHNCCSTCYEDQENDSDDDIGSERTIDSCHCGTCSACDMRQNADEATDSFPVDSFMTQEQSFIEENISHSDLASSCPYTDSDFSQLNNNDDYVEFYKDSLQFQSDQDDQGLGGETDDLIQNDGAKNHPNLSLTASNIHTLQEQDLNGRISATENEEQHLDYSVESAQDILGSNYSSRSFMNYDTCISPSLGSENDSGRYSMLPPAGVTMATIKTTTPPVAVASSKMGAPMTRSDSLRSDISVNANTNSTPHVAISEVNRTNSTEAPAKLITCRNQVAVLKAHAHETYTPASFQAIPLTRGRGHTLPQIPQKQRVDAIQSLQRTAGQFPHTRHFAFCPPSIPEGNVTVDGNNYLDVRASSNINKHKARMHPRQPITNTPRSLYLRHQKKELLQQQLREKQEKLLMDRDIVYQPAAFANDVGVPLQPTPSIVGYQQCNRHQAILHDETLHQNHLLNNPKYLCHPLIRNYYHEPQSTGNINCDGNSCPLGPNCNLITDMSNQTTGAPSYTYNMTHGACPSIHQQSFSHSYPNQVNLSPIEQYNAQLNSDVDYVIYPLKDPAISRQEYMDAKQVEVIAKQQQQQQQQQAHIQYQRQQHGTTYCTNKQMVPPYKSPKLNPLYRSTPNVAGQMGSGILSSYPSYQSLASHNSMHQPGSSSGYSSMARGRYYSQQSLASSLSSTPSGYSASTHSLTGSYDPYGEIVMAATNPTNVMRVRSDESILSSALDDAEGLSVTSAPPHHRPPPPYRAKVTMQNKRMTLGDQPQLAPAGSVTSLPATALRQQKPHHKRVVLRCKNCASGGASSTCLCSQLFAQTQLSLAHQNQPATPYRHLSQPGTGQQRFLHQQHQMNAEHQQQLQKASLHQRVLLKDNAGNSFTNSNSLKVQHQGLSQHQRPKNTSNSTFSQQLVNSTRVIKHRTTSLGPLHSQLPPPPPLVPPPPLSSSLVLSKPMSHEQAHLQPQHK